MTICPNCGGAVPEQARFCRNCAFDLTKARPTSDAGSFATVKMNQCSRCGAPMDAGARFCDNCAAPAQAPDMAETVRVGQGFGVGYAPQPYPRGSNKTAIIIAAIVGGVVLIGGIIAIILLTKSSGTSDGTGGGGGTASGPGEAIRKIVRATERGDAGEFLALSNKEFIDQVKQNNPGKTPKDALAPGMAQSAQEIRRKGGIKEVNIKSQRVDGDTATVDYEIKYGNGETEPLNARVIKEGGSWKVDVLDFLRRQQEGPNQGGPNIDMPQRDEPDYNQ